MTREQRDTLFLLAVCALATVPLLPHLAGWCSAVVLAVLAWRAGLAWRGRALPGRAVVAALLVAVAALTWWDEGTLLGRQAGVTMLTMLMALKTLELRARRDALVVFFLGSFLALAQFLYTQSPAAALWALASTGGLLTALALAHMPAGRPALREAAAVAGRAALWGLPTLLVLFLLFPRIGPLWSLPDAASGRTGLSDAVRAGSVADLALDDGVALRVRFDGPAPPLSALYFRGPVLSVFDGEAWTRAETPGTAPQASPATEAPLDLQPLGEPLAYTLMLEPGGPALLPLPETTAGPLQLQPAGATGAVRQGADLTWRGALAPTSPVQLRARAYAEARHGTGLGAVALRDFVDLPPGRNPRTMAWAAALRREPRLAEADALTLVAVALEHLQRGGYGYTLAPGLGGVHAADELWFDRRTGFCEHYASAFVVLMRALDVPARLVAGYHGADPEPVDGWWTVRHSHAHAWAEVWQTGRGWMRVDPTAAVAPQRLALGAPLRPAPGLLGQALGAIDPTWLRAGRRGWERAQLRWNEWVVGYSMQQQWLLMKQLGISAPDLSTLARALAAALAGTALAVLALPLLRRRPREPWAALHHHVARRLARLGVHVQLHESPGQRAQRLLRHHGAAAAPLAEVLQALERARYAQAGSDGASEPPRAWRRRIDAAARACEVLPRLGVTGSGALTGVLTVALAGSMAWVAAPAAQAAQAAPAAQPALATQAAPAAKKPPAAQKKQKKKARAPTAPRAQPVSMPAATAYGARDDVLSFATLVTQRHGLEPGWAERQLADARLLPTVQRLIMPPPAGTARNWAAYRDRFVEPRRVAAGVAFWQEHGRWLELAEARWGVPASLVVGIIGVETMYGRHMGNFRAIDALATLAFDFPPGRRDRSAFFRDELEELLLLARREGVEPAGYVGSFAGALGLPQFMPSSIRRYAVDFDGDGRVDLQANPADTIGSVANYLAAFGWQRDLPTHYPVAAPVDTADRATLLAPDIVPSFTAAQFAERGAALGGDGARHAGLLALVELQNGDAAPSYVAGTSNFYAVTRYNWSSYYALAVIELGRSVARAMPAEMASPTPRRP